MNDITFFLDNLKEKAIRLNNKEILKVLNSKSFFNSLCDICNVFNKLNLEVLEKSDYFDHEKEINLKISRALAQNYFVMYYVNINTDEYISYTKDVGYKALKIEDSGTDFYKALKKNIQKVIYKDDIEYVNSMLQKDKILEATRGGNTFSITYRLLLNNKPTYVTLLGTRLVDDPDNIILGVSNIDNLMKRELEYKKQVAKNITYSNIALALAADYFVIYYVDVKTSKYVEYSLDNEKQLLNVKSTGEDFFSDSKTNAKHFLVHEDQEKFLNAIKKENLLNELKKGTFKLSYRQIIDGKPTYVLLSCMKLSADLEHIIIAVSNIDAQKRRENEFKKELELEKNLARTDALTGTSNKYSYNELEIKINERIKAKLLDQFAVVLCDLNDLKKINDTLGHEAGDEYIKNAVQIISKIFKNTTIFRVGGDEFVLIIDGNNYYNYEYLIKKLKEINIKNLNTNNPVIACGISEFIPNQDKELNDVLKRADEAMYKDKKELKKIGVK